MSTKTIKINALPEATEISDDDIFIVESTTATNKVSFKQLKESLTSSPSCSASLPAARPRTVCSPSTRSVASALAASLPPLPSTVRFTPSSRFRTFPASLKNTVRWRPKDHGKNQEF